MKGWITGLVGLLVLVSGQQATWAYWEEFTDYRTEPVFGYVQVPTTHTVTVPDYGWVNQGQAVQKTILSANSVVVNSISQQTLLNLQTSAKGPQAGKPAAYRGNLSDRPQGIALTGLKGREIVGASKAAVSAPRAAKPGQSGGNIRGREPERLTGRDQRDREDDDRERNQNRERDRD